MSAKRTLFVIALTIGLLFISSFADDPVRDESQPLAPMWLNQSPTVFWWAPEIYSWAKEYDLNPNIIATLMQIESCGLPEAESTSSAQGLFQVMPFNFPNEYQGRMQDPEVNAEVGIQYYNYVLEKSGDSWLMAFAAYNGGPSKFSQPMALWPEETQKYYYWAQMANDALQNAERSERLEEWLATDGGRLCNAADGWQSSHQRDRTIAPRSQPGTITIDWPPSIWVAFLIVLGLLIRKNVDERIGNLLVNIVTVLVIALWFPMNVFDEKSRIYTNLVFQTREWFDEHQPIETVFQYVRKGVEVGLPLPETIEKAMFAYESTKDFARNMSLWMSRDPVLTPTANWASHLVWGGLYEKAHAAESAGEFAAPFDAPVQVRIVRDGRGVTNRYGIHGNFCFSCLGLQSWLGTDVKIDPDQYFYSPTDGVVERIIVDGGSVVGGSSVWIVGEDARVAVLHLLAEDAKQWQKGQTILKGQKIGRQNPADGHIHVILETQNPDGSWGDYPLVLVLNRTGIQFAWYDRTATFTDFYAPSVEELVQRSERMPK